MTLGNSLPAITALARAGAVARAWELFEAGGYLGSAADPAALAVKGRLLKDRARAAPADRRAPGFAEAAAAYAAADALAPAPYLAINAATLWLLAGDQGSAAAAARDVLARLDAPEAQADTPYYLAATRAEALLLLGEHALAEAALAEGAAHDPDGWDDRAVTLTQLRAILAARGESAAMLDRFAPPASLHFAGHMGVAAGGNSERELAAGVDALLAAVPIGFAWGAIAAGSDVIIAERLVAAGVELHAVLPCPPEAFAAQSVAPAGEEWLPRYRALLDAVASVRVAGTSPASVHDPLATGLAGELAIGGALHNARRLGAKAVQLIVVDGDGGGPNTARQAALWSPRAGPQHHLTIPRDAEVERLFPPESPDPGRELAVHVAVVLDTRDQSHGAPDSAALAAARAPLAAALAGLDPARVRAGPDGWDLILADPDTAVRTVLTLLASAREAGLPPPSAGAELAIATLVPDPASGALIPYGPGKAAARRLAAQAPPGLALIGDALAVTMTARGSTAAQTQLYHPGDEGPQSAAHALFAATPA